MASGFIDNGIYFIQNIGTGTVADLANGSSDNGTKVQGYSKRELNDPSASAQLWIITRVEHDEYTIRNANSCKYMDIKGGTTVDSTPVVACQGTGHRNQRWAIKRNDKKTAYVQCGEWQYVLLFVDSSETSNRHVCIDASYLDYGWGTENGTPMQIWAGIGPSTVHPLQLWHVVRA
ncbi:hypothetical protein DICSQDRAFT_172744 [Dichomitus squalens LYAD-421 SS1]|uniref:Ricin B lectin domain-containing protein n=1 Tax=Dichomitus squalens (strain LYAD-421) TaxID=732165 RepID=R7SRE2_DICSQ|nr:uncharacterized protein DICSQDRAFT_172744 [Dichomitus squalens LYAD-421 SS1]EJF58729.1 hypothetical protein DICSQDRAFT_172744 [Dichomitus squalens LYAD-421 SS1]